MSSTSVIVIATALNDAMGCGMSENITTPTMSLNSTTMAATATAVHMYAFFSKNSTMTIDLCPDNRDTITTQEAHLLESISWIATRCIRKSCREAPSQKQSEFLTQYLWSLWWHFQCCQCPICMAVKFSGEKLIVEEVKIEVIQRHSYGS